MTEPTANSPRHARSLETLSHFGNIVSSGRSLETVLQSTVHLIRTLLEAERCSILLLDPVDRTLRMKAAIGIDPAEWDNVRIPLGHGVAGTVAERGTPLLVDDVASSPWADTAPRGRYGAGAFVCVPLMVRGNCLGVLCANNGDAAPHFLPDDLELLNAVAGLLTLAIENARLSSAGEALRRHLERIVECLPIGLLTTDLHGRATLANQRLRTMLGLARSETVEGRPAGELLPAGLRADFTELCGETFRYGVHGAREAKIDAPAGVAALPIELGTAPLSDHAGEIDGIVATFHDLSLRRELDNLRQADELKSHFMSMVSHELRTPLTSIKGAVHLLLRSPAIPASPQQGQLLGIVEGNAERLARLVNDLLDMTQIEAGTLAIAARAEDLAPIARQVAESFAALAASRGIKLLVEASPAWAAVDRGRLNQAIGHLVDNAIKFTPRGGLVRIVTESDGPDSRVTVADTGTGVSPEAHGRLFSKFYQAQNPMTRNVGGTGIGLFLTRRILELHGGRVRATEGLDHGAEFVIELPGVEPGFRTGDTPSGFARETPSTAGRAMRAAIEAP